MAVMNILTYPDTRLTQEAQAVAVFDEQLRAFVADLEETMRAGPGAVGIAAPQVGRLQRVVLVDCTGKKNLVSDHGRLVLVNPEITAWDGYAVGREGCLSVPDFTGNVIRAERISLEAQNEYGVASQFQLEGYEARAVQHEIDHLDGLLFLDRLVSRRNDLFKRKTYQK